MQDVIDLDNAGGPPRQRRAPRENDRRADGASPVAFTFALKDHPAMPPSPMSRGALRALLAFLLLLLVDCKSSEPQHELAAASTGVPLASSAPVAAMPSAPVSSAPKKEEKRAWGRPLLYRIDGPKPSYLFGTIHVPDERLEPLLPPISRALAASDEVLTEMPMDPETQAGLAPKAMLPAGHTLKTELPPDLYNRASATLLAKGLPIAPFATLKVWVVATQMVLLDRLQLFATKKPLDKRIYEEAQAMGKATGGVETADEQLAAVDGFSRDEQAGLLRETMDYMEKQKKEGKDGIEEILGPYLSGDTERLRKALAAGLDPTKSLDAKLIKRMFTDRNKVMSDRIQAKLKANSSRAYFFAVGAGHVVGDDGIVATLTARGMKLSRVESD